MGKTLLVLGTGFQDGACLTNQPENIQCSSYVMFVGASTCVAGGTICRLMTSEHRGCVGSKVQCRLTSWPLNVRALPFHMDLGLRACVIERGVGGAWRLPIASCLEEDRRGSVLLFRRTRKANLQSQPLRVSLAARACPRARCKHLLCVSLGVFVQPVSQSVRQVGTAYIYVCVCVCECSVCVCV